MQIGIQMGKGIIEGIAMIYMGVCTIFDIRHREIPLLLIIFGMAAALGINLWQVREGAVTAAEVGRALIPGVFFLLTSFLTGEKVGYGDGLLLIIAGLLLGAYRCFLALCIGLVFSAAISLFLLLFRKANRHSRIPFAPFLVLGMGVVVFA
ncbi:MAG: prepilin peptidase [Lachnospiraceae bacterium]|nr:prepilin peptidase [Lachnospiraceae bacterium]